MIISDKYRFAFVHIPKCAGTSVRNALDVFDEWEFAGGARRVNHPSLGYLDLTHVPLFALRQHFEAEFDKVRGYWSFAIVRNPFTRFPSSISQRLKMYSDKPIQKQSTKALKVQVDQVIRFLSAQPRQEHILPAEFIHFQKQLDFIQLDGQQVLNSIYTTSQIGGLLEDIAIRVGDSFIEPSDGYPERANRTIVHRSEALRILVESCRPVAGKVTRVLPEVLKQGLRSLVYVPRDQGLANIFGSNYVREFIADYYADDIELFESAEQAATEPRQTIPE